MYVIVEYLTILALITLFASLLFAGSVVLVALGEGLNAVRRRARKSEPGMAQESQFSVALQPAILKEPVTL